MPYDEGLAQRSRLADRPAKEVPKRGRSALALCLASVLMPAVTRAADHMWDDGKP